MPIYAYRCTSCGHTKDVLRKLSDPPLTQCPSCGKQTFAKQVTAAGFQLKGSGWYATDFKGNGAKKPGDAKTDAGDGAKGDGAKTSDEAKKSDAAKPSDSTKADAASPAKSADTGASGGASSAAPTSPKPTGGSAGC